MRINLPEQTWIDHKPASFGSRALAYVIDLLIRWTLYLCLYLIVLFSKPTFVGKVLASIKFGNAIFAILIITVFILEIAYPIFFEVFNQGVSPGKKILKLRVVDERGLVPSLKTSLLRNLFIIVDLLPASGLVGLASMLINKNNQRIGDIVAKTLVIHEPQENYVNLETIEGDENLLLLPLSLYNVIEQYLKRKALFTEEARKNTLDKITEALRQNLSNTKLSKFELEKDRQLTERTDQLLQALFTSSAPQKKSNTKSTSDLNINWKLTRNKINEAIDCFNDFIKKTEKKSKEQIRSFSNSYQHICQIYSYLSYYYPNSAEARKAAFLTREGRKIIYGNRLDQLNTKISFLESVSAIFYKIRKYVLTSLMLAVIPGTLCFLAIKINPNLSWYFIDEEIAEKLSAGKIWTEAIQGQSEIAAANIMTNNIKVAIAAFVLGITAGVGTVYLLMFNGISIAGIFTSLTLYGMTHKLFNFVVAHGFLELSVIVVAGGCGLYLADAIINPGFISRKQKVQMHARELTDLIIFNSLCLVLAGVVEGFISPYAQISFSIKLLIGLTLGITYWLFLFRPYKATKN